MEKSTLSVVEQTIIGSLVVSDRCDYKDDAQDPPRPGCSGGETAAGIRPPHRERARNQPAPRFQRYWPVHIARSAPVLCLSALLVGCNFGIDPKYDNWPQPGPGVPVRNPVEQDPHSSPPKSTSPSLEEWSDQLEAIPHTTEDYRPQPIPRKRAREYLTDLLLDHRRQWNAEFHDARLASVLVTDSAFGLNTEDGRSVVWEFSQLQNLHVTHYRHGDEDSSNLSAHARRAMRAFGQENWEISWEVAGRANNMPCGSFEKAKKAADAIVTLRNR